MGLDVVLFTRGYARLTGDVLGLQTVAERLRRVSASETTAFEPLLGAEWTPLSPARLHWWQRVRATPPEVLVDEDDRVRICLEAMLHCGLPVECEQFLAEDAWGYVLTHQALVVVVSRWLDCEEPSHAGRLRHRYAARLVAETNADPEPSDLFFERLAMLSALGFAGEIRQEWVQVLVESQHADGCFPVSKDVACHPHPTGLALWVLGVLETSD
jgi:hypothetical protein